MLIAFERILDHVSTLEIKNIQLDTLSYLYSDYADEMGRMTLMNNKDKDKDVAETTSTTAVAGKGKDKEKEKDIKNEDTAVLDTLSRVLTIYRSNEKETPEMICQAFKYCTVSKVKQFIEFRDDLRKSLHRAIVSRQKSLVEVSSATADLDLLAKVLSSVNDDEMVKGTTGI
jgi:hypothetical protein